MCRQPHDVVEIVRHEDQGNVERPAQFVDPALKVPADGAVDCGERLIQGFLAGRQRAKVVSAPMA